MRFFSPQRHTRSMLRVILPALLAAHLALYSDAGAHAAAAAPTAVTPVTSIEGVSEYRLENGLRVLLAPDPSSPRMTVNMTYLVGSRHENYGETGMAHLLEHMLFKDSKNYTDAWGEFSRRGLAVNGSTSDDRTNYYATFNADPDTLAWYLGWQADVMVNSLIRREDLDSEMTVVRNEMERGENSPFRILMQKMSASAFEWHNYGKSTIGARSDVENVDIAQLRAFYEQYYQPDNAVLIVTGAFDSEATLKLIREKFNPISKPTRVLPKLYTTEPVQDGERAVTLRRNGGVPLVAAMYHAPAAGAPDHAALQLATLILGDTPSGRLHRALVGKSLATDVFGYQAESFDPDFVLFGAQLESSMDQRASLALLTDTLESISSQPFTEAEFKRAQDMYLNQWDRMFSDVEAVGASLSEAVAAGDWRLLFLQRDRVRKATLQQVQQAANAYLVQSNRTAGMYVPTDKPVRAPAQKPVDFQALFKGYTGDPNFTAAEAFDTSAANIDSRTTRSTLTVPNGKVELALLNKATRGDRVNAMFVVQSGDVTTLRGQRAIADAVGDLMLRGTPTRSRQQIDDLFKSLNATVSVSAHAGELVVDVSTVEKNLAPTLEAVLEIVRTAHFPPDQIAEYKRERASALQSRRSEPQALAARALARHDNPWKKEDPRYVPTFDEEAKDIDTLDRKALLAYRDRFIGLATTQFAAVGQFDAEALTSLLTRALTPWKAAEAYTRIPSPYREVASTVIDINTPDKANATLLARQWFAIQDTDPDYPALMAANYALGQSAKSRLWVRIREKDGLSYSAGSQVSVSSYQPSARWSIYASFAPANREKLETALQQEFARALKDGFTDQEVMEAKEALLNYGALARANDDALVSRWVDYMQQDRSFQRAIELEAKLKALTTEEVNAALRKYLKPDAFTFAVAGDFKP